MYRSSGLIKNQRVAGEKECDFGELERSGNCIVIVLDEPTRVWLVFCLIREATAFTERN